MKKQFLEELIIRKHQAQTKLDELNEQNNFSGEDHAKEHGVNVIHIEGIVRRYDELIDLYLQYHR